MAKFNFSDNESLEINKDKITNIDIISSKNKITNVIKNYLNFIHKKNILPELPKIIDVKYISENKFSKFIFNILQVEKYKYPKDYSYPASMNPETATLYISQG